MIRPLEAFRRHRDEVSLVMAEPMDNSAQTPDISLGAEMRQLGTLPARIHDFLPMRSQQRDPKITQFEIRPGRTAMEWLVQENIVGLDVGVDDGFGASVMGHV